MKKKDFEYPEKNLSLAARKAAANLGWTGFDAQVRASRQGSGGDFQVDGVLGFAKRNGMNPKAAAEELASEMRALPEVESDIFVSGPGFVNVRLTDDEVLRLGLAAGEGVWPDMSEKKILIDYSGPNCAKRMHVGHLRSTVIGDALRGMMEAAGAEVRAVNHLGDFGTPFGVIVEVAKEKGTDLSKASLTEIEALYKEGSARMKSDHKFAKAARSTTAKIQKGEEPEVSAWRELRGAGMKSMNEVYERLRIRLSDADARGESAYAEVLPDTMKELKEKGVAEESDGALCFFRESRGAPLILEKSDEAGAGYLYGATDAAALRERGEGGFDRLLYVVDSRQSDHFEALFEMGRRAGWLRPETKAEHAKFGMLLDAEGKPFKTRSGEAFLLEDLIALAETEAREANANRLAGEENEETFLRDLAAGALKYADLSRPKEGNVKFDAKSACSLTGNSAAYVQYAGARASSVVERAKGCLKIESEEAMCKEERSLALSLAKLRGACSEALERSAPNLALDALYETAQAFGSFYEACLATRESPSGEMLALERRVALCEATAAATAKILEPMGIFAPRSMPRAAAKPVIR